jgi:hypothetical protein
MACDLLRDQVGVDRLALHSAFSQARRASS